MAVEAIEEELALQLFEICLHRDEYFPGEVISGKVLLVTSRSLKTGGIYLKFEGRGSVRWKSRPARLCGLQKAEFVHEKKKYFSDIFRYDLDSLPEGSSVLTFDFELPTGIPQSIEGDTIMKQLKICYSLEILIRTASKDYRQEKGFTVKGILNLNAYPEISRPLCKTIREAMFDSCWSSSGRVVVLSFSVKKQGFVPGEQIKAKLVLQDGYNEETPLLGVEVLLVQEIELRIPTASRIRRRVVAQSDIMHISADSKPATKTHGQQRKLNFFLTIPEGILITYGNTDHQVHDFISIQYFLRMTMEQTSFPYNPIQIQLPIKIGTVFIKEEKTKAPIILLAPVPLALPKPRVPLANHARNHSSGGGTYKPHEKVSVDCVIDFPGALAHTCKSVPEIVVTSKHHVADFEKSAPSTRSASPRTPKRKLGLISNAISDSSNSLHKPIEAFKGCDSDSESFRSGVEYLQETQ